MKLVPAMLTALTCFLPTTASFVLLPPTSTTTTATLRDGCVGTDQRTSRSRSRSHSQPLPPSSSSSSLALLSPTKSKPARMAEEATCLAMVAESDSWFQSLVALGLVDQTASQMLEQHKETLAREVAIHKEDLAFRRLEFEHQQARDRQNNSARDANFEFEKARAARQDARDEYQRARDAKQDMHRHYSMLLDDHRDRYDDWERISTEIRQLQSGFFRRFFQSKADREQLQTLQTKKKQIKADLGDVRARIHAALTSHDSFH
mmetsp:Transcript_20940/g.59744  ORF Transcript_20940/g.59744 Transcript_20940/m.59744 type:complete len:262 (+) Transcript_20940:1481-2266(+)